MLYGAMNSPFRPLVEEVEEIAGLGFDYAELTMDPPQAHYSTFRKNKRKLSKTLDRLGMPLICHLPTFISTADLTPGLREASLVENILSLREASRFKPLKIVLHPSRIQGLGAMMREETRQYAMQALDRIVSEAKRLSLTVCVENMFPQPLSLVEPEDFDFLFEKYPTARMTLDTGHANIGQSGENRILKFIRRFPDRIGHIHVSDNSGRGDEHLPIGVGSIDFLEVVHALKEIGYDDSITIEVFSRDRDYLRISREKLMGMFES